MAEGMMNPNTQEQLMLVQSFEQLANAVGAEIPVSIESEMAAVKNGMRMSEDLQRILAEGNMQSMNQLRPDQIGDMRQDTGAAMMPRETTGAAMTEDEMMGTYQVDDGEMQMTPSQMKAMQESGAITPRPQMAPDTGRVMSLQEAIDAGFVAPTTRPQARPTAPMQSMRPPPRPRNLGGR